MEAFRRASEFSGRVRDMSSPRTCFQFLNMVDAILNGALAGPCGPLTLRGPSAKACSPERLDQAEEMSARRQLSGLMRAALSRRHIAALIYRAQITP